MENIYNYSDKKILLWIKVFDIEIRYNFIWKSKVKKIRKFIRDYFMISEEVELYLNNQRLLDKHYLFDYNYKDNDVIYVKFNPLCNIFLQDGKIIHNLKNFYFIKNLKVNITDIKNLLKFNNYLNMNLINYEKVYSDEFEIEYPEQFVIYVKKLSWDELLNLILLLQYCRENKMVLIGNVVNYIMKEKDKPRELDYNLYNNIPVSPLKLE